ncbi:MAG: phage virion morphogenesis protein [Spirochaetales bacterium]|nr:phage virion morphogenesis protein [Spirochaetales bacterium]
MVTAGIKIIEDQRYIRAFNRIGVEIRDFSIPFSFIYEDFKQTEKQIFESEGLPERFLPLSPRYRRWKEQHYPGRKIMQLTRRLIESLVSVSADTIMEIKRSSAAFGTRTPYAHRHQMGTFGMPQRKIVQITEEVKRRWDKIVHRWVMRLFDKYGITTYEEYISFGGFL